jgi:hypothetical protein
MGFKRKPTPSHHVNDAQPWRERAPDTRALLLMMSDVEASNHETAC